MHQLEGRSFRAKGRDNRANDDEGIQKRASLEGVFRQNVGCHTSKHHGRKRLSYRQGNGMVVHTKNVHLLESLPVRIKGDRRR